jgi:hypothetical protein
MITLKDLLTVCNPDSNRFADDIRALEYAINILEVVGL